MTRAVLVVAALGGWLTACDQLFHVRTGTLSYNWGPQVADQTVIVPVTFALAAVSMLVTAARAGVTRAGSSPWSAGLVTALYLVSGLLPARYAVTFAVALVAVWGLRIALRGEVARLAAVGVAIAAGGLLAEAALVGVGEFSYAESDVLGVPWWLFGLYLHGSLAAVDLAYRLRVSPPSTGSMTPLRKLAAGDSRNAAVRPNSAGSP
ncbi:MAG: hypothetical protein JWR27_2327 [Aeromicrobium sp.]|nr:hypothetical protein [Aeromicrobium sp.]